MGRGSRPGRRGEPRVVQVDWDGAVLVVELEEQLPRRDGVEDRPRPPHPLPVVPAEERGELVGGEELLLRPRLDAPVDEPRAM